MKALSTGWLLAVLAAGLLTFWIQASWAAAIVECGSYLIAAGWAVWLARRGERPRLGFALIMPSIFTLIGLGQLAGAVTLSASETAAATVRWGAITALVFAGLQTFTVPGRFLRALFGFGLALAILSTVQTFTSNGHVFWLWNLPDSEFLMGPFPNHGHYAIFIELILPLALIPAVQDPRKNLWHWVAAGALIASVVASASRAGFLFVVAEALIVVLLASRARLQAVLTGLAAIPVVTLALAGVVGWDRLAQRLQSTEPFAGRQEMFRATLAMVADSGWFGFGLGTWPLAYPKYAVYDDGLIANHAHNDWAEWTAEGGVPALGAALFGFVWSLRALLRSPWCAGPGIVMIHALVEYPFEKTALVALFFALLAAEASSRTAQDSGQRRIEP